VEEGGRVFLEKDNGQPSRGQEAVRRLALSRGESKATGDPCWSAWSRHQPVLWLDTGPVVINAIIDGEIGFAFERIEALDALLPAHLDDDRAIPREAAFLAARAHADYRERGGTRQMILPDVLIGAHALVENLALRAGSAALALCWADSSKVTKLLPVPAQPAQISSSFTTSPGK
jgi:predicted nucleic acid-binding protein